MVFYVNFKTKSTNSKRVDRSASYSGKIYFEFSIINNIPIIKHGELLLDSGEFNEHQQPKFSTNKGLRKSFSERFGVKFNSFKNLIKMDVEQLEWWNTKMRDEKYSILSISKYLTGNNPSGSEQKKSSAEFLLSDGANIDKPFYNLLKVLSESSIKSRYISKKDEAMTYDEFLGMCASLNENIKDMIEIFYSEMDFFYIDENKIFIGITDEASENIRSAKFRNSLISKYDRVDQLYKVFKARKMVEAAHIIPISHISKDPELSNDLSEDIENGILLSPDIHKLFDSGAITFNRDGTIRYTTNKNDAPYNLTKSEVQRLELDNYKLDRDLLTSNRIRNLEYHNNYIYKKGV